MPAPNTVIVGAFNPVEGKVVSVPSHQAINDKIRLTADEAEARKNVEDIGNGDTLDSEIKAAPPQYDGTRDVGDEKGLGDDDVIIITGADASRHLLSLRDDRQPALTFRSLFLATCLSAFQAVMNQIYQVITYASLFCFRY